MNRHEAARAPWPRPATALRETLAEGYTAASFRRDLLAGAVVGIVALPLSMALAIASGRPAGPRALHRHRGRGPHPPARGLARAGVGPDRGVRRDPGAHLPAFGLGGLLLATLMAGAILFAMGVMRLGRFIEFVPYPVTTGFTAGIAVVIATLQVKDLLGLTREGDARALRRAGPGAGAGAPHLPLAGRRDRRADPRDPGPLAAAHPEGSRRRSWRWWSGPPPPALAARLFDFDAATIATRFTYRVRSAVGHGIPPLPPLPVLPWYAARPGREAARSSRSPSSASCCPRPSPSPSSGRSSRCSPPWSPTA